MRKHQLFLSAVLKNWRYAVGLGLLPAIALIEHVGRVHVPQFGYWLVVCLTLYIVFFKTWRDEHRRAETLEYWLLCEYISRVWELHRPNTLWDKAHEDSLASQVEGDKRLIRKAIENVKNSGQRRIMPPKPPFLS